MDNIYGELCSCKSIDDSIFSFVGHEKLKKLGSYFQCKSVSAGEVLWEEGDPCDYAAFIVSGRVEVMKQTEFKGKHVVVGIYGRGAVVGALCILDGGKRAITAKALEDSSITTICRDKFNELLKKEPELGAQLMKGMLLSFSTRLRKSFERLATFF
jgi:CRP/FNR family cyclic AMP-dependent transcriptional regulator